MMGSLVGVPAMKHNEERLENWARLGWMREKASPSFSPSDWPQWPITSLNFFF